MADPIVDDLVRLVELNAAEMDNHRAAMALLAAERADAVRTILARGVSLQELADRLGVHRQTVWRLARPQPSGG